MVVTETSVVQVTLLDASGYSKSLNIDNPKQNLTLNQIKAAFRPAIDGKWLYGRSDLVVEVQKATYSTATKVPIGGGEISITPGSYNIDSYSGGAGKYIEFTYEGGTPTASYIEGSFTSDNSGFSQIFSSPRFNTSNNKITLTYMLRYQNGGKSVNISGTVYLNVFFGNDSVKIPITANFNYTEP